MKKVKSIKPEGLYLARSTSSANSLFFERKIDHEIFINLVDKYLSEFIEVVHYCIVPTGWILVFRTKTKEEIEEFYFKFRSQSKKAKLSCTKWDTEAMISEHFRFLNSQLVIKTNVYTGRHGSKVHSRFEKFIFESDVDMRKELDKMEALELFNEQWVVPYLVDLSMYDDSGMEEASSEYRSGKKYRGDNCRGDFVMKCYVRMIDLVDVVGNLIKTTFKHFFNSLSPPFPSIRV